MSLYFTHPHQSHYSDDTYKSVFIVYQEGNESKVYVKLRASNIAFIYYDASHSHMEHPITVGPLKPLFSIPLDDPSLLNRFLLLIDEIKCVQIRLRNNTNKIYYHDVMMQSEKHFDIPSDVGRASLYELLLCFFDEITNPSSDFHKHSPKTTSIIKNKLEKSYIYKLIVSKYSVYRSLKDWYNSERSDYFRVVLQNASILYLDMLMDDELVKQIPADYFSKTNWFDIPEKEVAKLIKIDRDKRMSGHLLFKDIQLNQIQQFYYRKNSVLSAWSHYSSRYYIPIIGHITVSFLFLLGFVIWSHNIDRIGQDSGLARIFESPVNLLYAGVLLLLVTLVIQYIQQRFTLGSLLPRVMITLATAWVLLMSNDDLIINLIAPSNLLLISGSLTGFIVVCFIVYAKCHSRTPYYKISIWNNLHHYKVIPIVVYTFNISVLLGLLANLFFVNDFVKSLNFFSDQSYYKSEIQQLNVEKSKYLQAEANLNRLIGYQQAMISQRTGYDGLGAIEIVAKPDTIIIQSKTESMKLMQSQLSLYNTLVSLLNDSVNNPLSVSESNNLSELNHIDVKDVKLDSLFDHNFVVANEWLGLLNDSIGALTICIGQNSENLMKRHIYTIDNNQFEPCDCFGLFSRKNNKFIIESRVFKDKFIYYKLLIIQVFIAIIVALIGQLVLSDKTITEKF